MDKDIQSDTNIVLVGKLVGVYGVKGWLKLISFTRPEENIFNYHPWLLKCGGQWQQLVLTGSKVDTKTLLACFKGVSDREKAKMFIGAEIAIRQEQLPVLKDNEVYWHDLINMQVIGKDNESLGIISEILETGSNDVLVVKSGTYRHLIPYVPGVYVNELDISKGVIQVNWQSDY